MLLRNLGAGMNWQDFITLLGGCGSLAALGAGAQSPCQE